MSEVIKMVMPDGTVYDSFPDQTARDEIAELNEAVFEMEVIPPSANLWNPDTSEQAAINANMVGWYNTIPCTEDDHYWVVYDANGDILPLTLDITLIGANGKTAFFGSNQNYQREISWFREYYGSGEHGAREAQQLAEIDEIVAIKIGVRESELPDGDPATVMVVFSDTKPTEVIPYFEGGVVKHSRIDPLQEQVDDLDERVTALESVPDEPNDVRKQIDGLDERLTDAEEQIEKLQGQSGNGDGQAKIEGTPIEQTCIKFAKMLYGTDKAESFLYFTDPHTCNPPNRDAENRILTSFNVLKTYYDATPTNFLLCGGDWLNDVYESNTNDDACYKLGRVASLMRAMFDRCYTVIGNHEDNEPYGAAYEGAGRYTIGEGNGLPMATIRNLMLPYEKELYYSFDGARTKFYMMNSSDIEGVAMTDYRWEQVAWLAERLKEDDAENSALVIHSALGRPIGEGVFDSLAENLLKLCEAYNNGTTITLNGATYDFTDCTGCVRYMLAGHVHDADCAEIHYGIPVILTRNMLASADSGNGYKPTFDLCLADYDKEVMRMVRVGAYGTDRDVPLASRTFNGNTYSVKKTLTDVTASNPAVIVREGVAYENTLTVPFGYVRGSVVVTMGGVDITATAYSGGQISIGNVTGDITITATAIAPNYTNLADPTSEDWVNDGALLGDATLKTGGNNPNAVVTNYIPITEGDVLRFKGFDRETSISGYGQSPYLMYYDENKARVTGQVLQTKNAGKYDGLPTSVVADENGVIAHTMIIRGDTNEQYTYNNISTRSKYVRISALRTVPVDEIVITLNEEIE